MDPSLYLKRTRDFSVFSVKPEEAWPPAEWNYVKTIAGSPNSKYDFRYISLFNWEEWTRRFPFQNTTLVGGNAMEDLGPEGTVENRRPEDNTIGGQAPISIPLCDDDVVALCCCAHRYRESGTISHEGLEDLHGILRAALLPSQHAGSSSWFVRLSWRSPKDVPEGRLPSSVGSDVLNALIKSERCRDDLIAYRWHQLAGDWTPPRPYLHLVPWNSSLQVSRELRCFVHQNRLVAVSQQAFTHIFDFNGKVRETMTAIHAFLSKQWNSGYNLGHSLNSKGRRGDTYSEACVVDVNVSKDLQTLTLVELNPYWERGSTSAGLFRWRSDFVLATNDFRCPTLLRFLRFFPGPSGVKDEAFQLPNDGYLLSQVLHLAPPIMFADAAQHDSVY